MRGTTGIKLRHPTSGNLDLVPRRPAAMILPKSLLFASFLALLCSAASVVTAQGTRILNTVERRIDTMNRQATDYERDKMGREVSPKNDPESAKRTRQIRVEIEEDLNSLQTAYNSGATALQNGVELRPGFVAELARSVRKHAARLKANLALPGPEENEEKPAVQELSNSERRSLLMLCRGIYELVTNPMFESAGVFDVKNGLKARSDLQNIIRIADQLGRSPESSSK